MAERTPEQEAYDLVVRLWDEARAGLELTLDGKTLWELRDRNARRYLGDHWDTRPKENLKQATINRTGAAIIATTSVQTAVPLKLQVTPQQSQDEALVYLTDRGIRRLKRLIADGIISPESFPLEIITSEKPVSQQVAEALEMLLETQMSPEGMPMPPLLKEDIHVVQVTDQKVAETLQIIAEQLLDEASSDYYQVELETLTNIHGDQALLFEFDPVQQRVHLSCPNWTNVRYDPQSTWVDNARYVMIRQFMPIRDAVKQFPDAQESIAKAIQSGAIQTSQSMGANFGEGVSSKSFYTGQESISGYSTQPSDRVQVITLYKRGSAEDIRDIEQSLQDKSQEGDENLGKQASTDTKKLLAKATKHNRPPIRKISILLHTNTVVEDVQVPYSDIPIPWSKNIMIPYSPYGQGEPYRLEWISDLINRCATAILNMLRFNQYPEQIMPTEVVEALEQRAEDLYSFPSRIIPVEGRIWDDYIAKAGSKGFSVDPPQISDSWVHLLRLFLEEHQRLSGDQNAIQGIAVNAQASGKLQEQTEAAASRVMTHKAKSLEWVFQHISRLTLEAAVEFLDDSQWEMRVGNYSKAVRASLRKRAKSLRFDVKVEALAGRGQSKVLQAQKAAAMFDRGALSRQTYLNMNDHPDARGELMRINEEQRREQSQQLAMQGAAQLGLQQKQAPAQGGPVQARP